MKRAILLEGTGQELILSKVTAVSIAKLVFHLDELPDGTWRLTYNSFLIADIKKFLSLGLFGDDMYWNSINRSEKTHLIKTIPMKAEKGMIHFEQHIVDKWKLIYSNNFIPDFYKVTALKMIREN